jgi:hypothetical protein
MMTGVPSRKVSTQRSDSLAAWFAPTADRRFRRARAATSGSFRAVRACLFAGTAVRAWVVLRALPVPGFAAVLAPAFLPLRAAGFLPVVFAMTVSLEGCLQFRQTGMPRVDLSQSRPSDP